MCIGFLSVVIMCGITIINIDSKMIRRDELENAVAVSCKNTITKMTEEKGITESKKAESEFINDLFLNIESDSDNINIKFYGVDCKRGLLSVGVTEKYKNLLGKTVELYVKRTVILQ